jgi:plastocyanin
MRPVPSFARRRGATTIAAVVVGVLLMAGAARVARVAEPAGGPPMSDAAMKMCVSNWFASHPAHGAVPAAALAATPADTFRVISFRFDTDGKSTTQVDTARIVAGQTILFKHSDGFHTTTSGKPTDLDAGSLWDLPVDPTSTEVVIDFPTPGTYPFFCRPHGQFFNMRGVVVVTENTAGVSPGASAEGAGFVGGAWPNPSRQGASFRFRIDRSGDARIRMLDASGRVVALVLDAPLAPGVHEASWSARRADGSRMQPGTYWALLEIHGARSSTKVVLSR